MSNTTSHISSTGRRAYIITGPTSGIGRATALELAKHGMVVLVGRDRQKLDEVKKIIEKKGQRAVSVVCDLSDISSVRRSACGKGDRWIESAHRWLAQQRRHHADTPDEN